MDHSIDCGHDILEVPGNGTFFPGQGNRDEKTVYGCTGMRGTGKGTDQNERDKTQIQNKQSYNFHGCSDHGIWGVMDR